MGILFFSIYSSFFFLLYKREPKKGRTEKQGEKKKEMKESSYNSSFCEGKQGSFILEIMISIILY